MRRTLICILTALGLAIPVLASAEPVGFKKPRSAFALGIDCFDTMLGDFGDASDVGMSLFAETSLQVGGYFGLNIRFGSARAFTKKDFLPFDNGYQYTYIVASPRFYLAPFSRQMLYLYLQPDISMHILVSNTLVKITGNDKVTGAAGGSLGVQYIIGPVVLFGQVTCQYNWEYESVIVGGGLSVGVSSLVY